MSETSFDAAKIVDALAPLLGFELSEASRAQVVLHLKIAADHAARVLAEPLADSEEPAPVFTP